MYPIRRCKCGVEHECSRLDARANGKRRWRKDDSGNNKSGSVDDGVAVGESGDTAAAVTAGAVRTAVHESSASNGREGRVNGVAGRQGQVKDKIPCPRHRIPQKGCWSCEG